MSINDDENNDDAAAAAHACLVQLPTPLIYLAPDQRNPTREK